MKPKIRIKGFNDASLQAMFPQKGETVPKIRFKGFEGEWEEVKLSSFAKRIKRRNSCMESTLALTIASALGLVSQNDYFNNSVVGANIRNYYLLKRGEFAYNKSYSNGYPFGSVKRLDRYEQGRIQRANALRHKVIKSFRKNTQKEYKNLIFLLVGD